MARPKARVLNLIQVSKCIGTQGLIYHLLPVTVHIKRMLQLEVEPGLESRHLVGDAPILSNI